MPYFLRLIEDTWPAGRGPGEPLPRLNRVLFVLDGDVSVSAGRSDVRLQGGQAWHGGGECAVRAGTRGARLLRFELYRDRAPSLGGGVLKLEHRIDLDPAAAWLMRCDRVDFAPGGEAPLHRHRGGGIRRLLRGRIEVTVGDEAPKKIEPGGAWFESGREPVYAVAALDEDTSFIRVTIQPAEIRGQSSIMYVNPADATRKPRQYAVFADEPIEI